MLVVWTSVARWHWPSVATYSEIQMAELRSQAVKEITVLLFANMAQELHTFIKHWEILTVHIPWHFACIYYTILSHVCSTGSFWLKQSMGMHDRECFADIR